MAEFRLQDNQCNPADDSKRSENCPEPSAALFAFLLFESVACVTRVSSRTVFSFFVEVTGESSQDVLNV